MSGQSTEVNAGPKGKLGLTIQVRLVSDLKKSQEYYRDVLGCKVDSWGHAERDDMVIILQQAACSEDVRPNAPSRKRPDYPTEWEYKNAYIQDPDGYSIVLGAMRENSIIAI